MSIRGIFRLMYLYDVSESIDLAALRTLLGERGGSAEPSFPRRTPSYVRFEQAPVVEPAEIVTLGPGVKAACPVKYYGFGAIVVQVELPFDCADWKSLVEQGARWVEPPEVEPVMRALAKRRMDEIRPTVSKPADEWLQETYLVTEIDEIHDEHGAHPTADDLIEKHSEELVQLTRGEVVRLAPKSVDETMQGSLTYFPNDLVIVGSHGAVVYDKPEDAVAVTQILEYAKMQLLEFRYYDKFLTHVLEEFYSALERPRNPFASRWSLPREAQRFNTIRLDVMELTERIDNAIKFVSDIYYARIYRLAAARMGVQDYRNLVDEKLATFGELYDSMIDRFNEMRSFVIEVLIAILAAFDVILLFRWH